MAREQSAVNMRLINLFPVTGLAQGPNVVVFTQAKTTFKLELANSVPSYRCLKLAVKNSFSGGRFPEGQSQSEAPKVPR